MLLLSVWNLSHNNFVIPESRFWNAYVFISDYAFRVLYYAPLLLPLWVWAFFRESTAGFGQVMRQRRTHILAALLLICFLLNFPASYVMLDGSLVFRDLFQIWVIRGLSVPSSLFFLVLSLIELPEKKAGSDSADAMRHKDPFRNLWKHSQKLYLSFSIVFVLLSGLYALRLWISGSALPRLEDELAYYLQALVFESGNLRARLDLAFLGEAGKLYLQAFDLPYVFVKDGFFYSVHQHGFSYLLSLTGASKHYVNYAFMILAIVLFYLFLNIPKSNSPLEKLNKGAPSSDSSEAYQNGFASERPVLDASYQPWALLFFASAPVLFFQSDSFMSHPLALCLGLLCACLYFGILARKRSVRLGASLFGGLLFIGCGVGLSFVRLQTALPLLAALGVYELSSLLFQAKDRRPSSLALRRSLVLMALILLTLGLSYVLLNVYANRLGSKSLLFTGEYFRSVFGYACQSIGFGPGHGCFPTLGTLGYSFRKFLLRIPELSAMSNQELNAFGLPLGALLGILGLRYYRVFTGSQSLERFSLILLAIHVFVFSLYFHNGGESYQGRYLSEVSPFLIFLVLRLLGEDLRSPQGLFTKLFSLQKGFRINRPRLLFSIVLMLLATQFLRVRGGYFHASLAPVRRLEAAGKPIQKSLVTIKEKLPFLEADPHSKNTRLQVSIPFADEFRKTPKVFTKTQLRAAFQGGLGSLLARASRIDKNGLVWDKDGNLLTGELSNADALLLQKRLGLAAAYRLHFSEPRLLARGRRWKLLKLESPELKDLRFDL